MKDTASFGCIRRGVFLGGMLVLAAPAAVAYESRLDNQYRSLSNSISRAFYVPSPSYTPQVYKSAPSSYSNYNSTPARSYQPSYSSNSSSSYGWKDYTRSAPVPVQPSIWQKREADHKAMVRKALSAGNKPEPIPANESALTRHYASFGLDLYTAGREARGEIFRAMKSSMITVDSTPRVITEAERAAFRANAAREEATRKAAEAQARSRAHANPADQAALRSWMEKAEQLCNNNQGDAANREAHVAAVEFAAENGLPGAMEQAWALLRPGTTTNIHADEARAKHWQNKLLAVGNVEATISATYNLVNLSGRNEATGTNFAAGAELLEKAYSAKASTKIAIILTRVHANGDATLAADASRAWRWYEAVMQGAGVTGEDKYYALKYVADNAEVVAAHGPQLVKAHEELLNQNIYTFAVHRALADILSGRDKRYSNSGVPLNKERASELALQALSTTDAWKINKMWAAEHFWDTRQFDAAQVVHEKLERDAAFGNERWRVGLFWRDRPDGKANWDRAFSNFSVAAEDLAHGGLLMAELYFEGNGPAVNPAKAVEWLRWGVKKNQASSMFRLAQALMRGEGTEQNLTEARQLIEQGLKDTWIGNNFKLDARLDLVLLNAQEELTQTTPAERFKTLQGIEGRVKTLALQDGTRAQTVWSDWVLNEGVAATPENKLLAMEFLREQAMARDARAQYTLGSALFNEAQSQQRAGLLDAQAAELKYVEAADLLESAWDLKYALAARGLGVMYRDGLGKKRDLPQAISWLEKAVAAGDNPVAFLLAECYLEAGPTQNTARALTLLQQGVEREDFRAMNLLGVLHLKGLHVTQDSSRAVDLFGKAATAGHWESARNRFKVRYTGMGVPASPEAAIAEFQGYTESMAPRYWFMTGLLFLNDPAGLPFLPAPRPDLAKPWLEKAKAAGVTGAAEKLASLK